MKKTIEKKLEKEILESIDSKKPLGVVEKKYDNYTNYILNPKEHKFYHLPKNFSKIKNEFVKYKKNYAPKEEYNCENKGKEFFTKS